MQEKKRRIETNAAQDGLNSAFSQLNVSGLPTGPEEKPSPPATPNASPAKKKLGRVVLRRETAHRGGKCVVVIDELPTHLNLPQLERLASSLKSYCGSGGTVRERTIEIQGEQVAKVRAFLEKEGFQVAGVR